VLVCLFHQGHQPLLEQLHLSGNQLTTVEPPPNDAAFPLLRTLLLAGNKIAEWCDPSNVDLYGACADAFLLAQVIRRRTRQVSGID